MVGTAIAFSAYMLIDITRNINGFSSIWFLAVLPTFLSALICYIADPDRSRSSGFYIAVPVVLVIIVGIGSIIFFHEGLLCLIMLWPVWIGFGWIGAFVVYRLRKRRSDPTSTAKPMRPRLTGFMPASKMSHWSSINGLPFRPPARTLRPCRA